MTTRTAIAADFRGWLSRGGRQIADTLWPPQCLRCHAPVDMLGTLCVDCWPLLRFVERPFCASCGMPFAYDPGDPAICGTCVSQPPRWGRARSAVVYDDASKHLVLALKHGDRTDTAPALGQWMARAGTDILTDADLLVPVPLHWSRLFRRRFNQASLLAQAVSRRTGVAVFPDALVRKKRTRALGSLGPSARRTELKGAIGVSTRARSRLIDARVVLVDDVHTTGTTLTACTAALFRAGAATVDILTFARTLKADPT